jgi:beta-glucanase (GH16 family)
MSASGTLNLNDYTTVWDHNFTTQPNLDGFGTVWGDVQVQNGAAVITSSAANGWQKSGFMITPAGASAGTGYGLYSITMALSDHGAVEGPGGYACLWPASNNWPGPELDLVEKGDASSGSNGYSTIHWAGADGSNQYTARDLGNIDVTQKHTYAMDWEPGRITLYVDGQQIYTTTDNVPKDYADGGQNEAFGAGEEPAWAAALQGGNSQNQVQVYDISYAAYTPTTSSPTPGGNPSGGTPSGGTTSGGTTSGGTTSGGTTPDGSAPGGASNGTSSGPSNITLSGDNLTPGSTAWTVVGQLSATDSTPVNFALGDNPGHLFSIDGNKLLINQDMPANPPSSYQVGIIAVDSTGAIATQEITVGVQGASAQPASGGSSGGDSGGSSVGSSAAGAGGPAVSVGATDSSGATASLPLAQGTQTLDPAKTGLAGPITETAGNGVTEFSTPSGSGVEGLTIQDSAGGSYQTDGFAKVQAALSGASAGSLAIDGAQNATVSLGDGNYAVRVSSLVSSATVQISGGSGTDQMTFLGSGHASFTAGAGSTVIVGGQGGNDVTFGTGTSQVWGGLGADSYTFHAGDGLQVIETFDAAKGDVLNIDSSLKSALQVSSAGGSTMLSLGGASHGIMLQGVSHFDTAQIHWI